jgi:hypothetical protein
LSGAPSAELPMLLAALEAGLKKPQTSSAHPEKPKILLADNYQPENSVQKPQPQIQESIIIEEAGEVMTLPEVRMVWPKVVDKIKAINSPLASLLRNGELLDVLGNKIILGVKFLFNKQNLEHPKNFSLICAAFEEVAGKKMAVAAQVTKQETVHVDSSQALSQALQVFGGELID